MESQFSYNWKLWERQKQELLKFCMEDKWEKVVDMYNTYPILQYAQLTASEETALHIAVWKGTAETIKSIVEAIEDLWRRCRIPRSLGLPNDQGNTPLHVAALIGNVNEGTQPEFPFPNSGDPPGTPMDSKKKLFISFKPF